MTHTKENKGTLTSDLISVRLNVCFCIVVSKLHISQITQCTQEVLEIESLKSLNKKKSSSFQVRIMLTKLIANFFSSFMNNALN